ncbi:substrate-binding domain-containing protein [Thermodesulforhabdus norvegica]|uniref:Tungstate transport system substrate-binding protein n=1 Tax=Thermodesulforhabdus norvegica TaxID=39841 RepID=A0A1I4SE61_9BACT|nr:substrate-binding domain-containing protein [Thermodesulforhabdus norvegica]SFM62769.1 tungstate transport system substrate-binding protein [Thermodesulforhabdus norvegica]
MSRLGLKSFVMGIVFLFVAVTTDIVMAEEGILRMATTTSTDNTGLLDYLAPRFKEATGIELQWVAVGTGKALELGKNCDVDVLLVHAPEAEKKFVSEGYGVDRREVMYNDFVIIGPSDDPAGIAGMNPVEALKRIAAKKAIFVSRGDNSGTHKKEMSLWKEAGIEGIDRASWYVQTGQGMIATINVAAERGGYTLADRGTYITYQHNLGDKASLVILVEGDKRLFNQYSVIAVNPDHCPKVHYEKARRFIEWIVSPEIQKAIGDYRMLGKPLFVPNAGRN